MLDMISVTQVAGALIYLQTLWEMGLYFPVTQGRS